MNFPIYKADQTPFYGLVLRNATVDSVVMSLRDKITGDVYYKDNTLAVTMQEYIVYDGVRYVMVNPPTVLREGMASDNGELKGMTKYSFEFYHPMYMLSNLPFCDIAVTASEEAYLAQNKTFSWIGDARDYVAKLNANLVDTQWVVRISDTLYENGQPTDKIKTLSEVLTFDNVMIADALKTAYDTYGIPFIIDKLSTTDADYGNGKKFLILFGLPSTDIIDSDGNTFVFKFGQGVGLKNNSRTPRNNKIVTRIAGYGSRDNIPYGYPQIVWTGDQSWKYTINNASGMQSVVVGGETVQAMSYPIYDGIVGGAKVKLIKHPFTRDHLMPSVYAETVNRKVNPLSQDYNPNTKIIDYYDADNTYTHPIVLYAPSYESHEFADVKPELGDDTRILSAAPYDEDLVGTVTYDEYDEEMDDVITAQTDSRIVQYMQAWVTWVYNKTRTPNLSPVNVVADAPDGTFGCEYSVVPMEKYVLARFSIKDTSGNSSTLTPFWYYNVMYAKYENLTWDDTVKEDGKYKQGYFKITLPVLQFDLYASAALTQEMKIVMRSGACLGCTFSVVVDWDDYKKNFYNANAEFDPVPHTSSNDSHVRDITKYPDSTSTQITLIVQKDKDTFGTLMPNMYQEVKGESSAGEADGDKIVFIGISLPLSYITNAQQRLDQEMKKFMSENNEYYYDYPLKFDEHFLTTHQNILSQIRNNTKVVFEYAGAEQELYVKQITVKYGDSVLPSYSITLTDNIDVVLNKIGAIEKELGNTIQVINTLQGSGKITDTTSIVTRNDYHGNVYAFYYYAGEWSDNSVDKYEIAEDSAPYFSYGGVQNAPDYWMWVGDSHEDGITMHDMGTPSSTNDNFKQMTSKFSYIITEMIFGKYANFGSAIINGDWLISTNGTINGVAYNSGAEYTPATGGRRAAFTFFDPAYPSDSVNTTHTVNSTTWTGYNFVPNYAVDLLTGASYQQTGFFKGNIEADSGTFSGFLLKKKTTITSSNIGEYTEYDSSFDEYYMLFEKCGTYLEFSGLLSGMTLYFSGNVNQFGNTAIIENKSNYNILISGAVSLDGESPVSFQLSPDEAAFFEAKMTYNAGGQGIPPTAQLLWVCKKYGIS